MPKKKAVWTVMVYLAGDNNLTTECLFALTEMKKAMPGDHLNIIAQFDPRDERVPTQRYEINHSDSGSSIFEDIIDEAHFDPVTREVRFRVESENAAVLARSRQTRQQAVADLLANTQDLSPLTFRDDTISDETDTGSPVAFYNFLSFGIQEYPAEHYMVVLSGHSGGTAADYLLSDESPRGSLTFNELKAVFEQLRKDLNGQVIDIIGMDNCLMSMAEICYELRGHAQFLVGSETYSPASGWPYRQILENLNANKDSSAREVAKAIVLEYANYYSGYWLSGLSVAQSALDLSKVEKLSTLIDSFAQSLERELIAEYEPDLETRLRRRSPHPFRDALVLAHWEAQSYNGELFVDLYDFCDCLEGRVTSSALRELCANIKEFLTKELVVESRFVGARYQYSYGLSLYFPWSAVESSYWNLDFVRQSVGGGWGSFLSTYSLITRRDPRDPDVDSNLLEVPGILNTLLASQKTGERMTMDRMTMDRMTMDRMTMDRMTMDRMMSSIGSNPIHSMRNPPIVYFPSRDDDVRSQTIATQERFWGPKAKVNT